MIRRIVLVAAAAVALVLTPSIAMAYDAPGFSSSVSDSTPAIGASTTLTVRGGMANANKMITLVIAPKAGTQGRTQSFTQRANAAGDVTFTFTLNTAGSYTAQAKNAAGALVSDQELTVGGTTGTTGAPTGDKLSDTGFNGTNLALGGGLLVLVGASAVVVARRRRSAVSA